MTILRLFSIPLIGIGSFGILYSLFATKSKIYSFGVGGTSVISSIIELLYGKSPIFLKRIILFFVFIFFSIIAVLMFLEN